MFILFLFGTEILAVLYMGLGHVHNILFPFNIEADTAVAVASEMVGELELTDQDVTTIAEMIESEIRHHLSVWSPCETSVDSFGEEIAVSGSCASENEGEAFSVGNASSASFTGTLALERLPSGRKFWSDSPNSVIGNSSLRPIASNLPLKVDVATENGSLTGNYAMSVHQQAGNFMDNGYCSGKKSSGLANSHSTQRSITSEDLKASVRESPLEEKSGKLDVNLIGIELEKLVVTQQEELEKLKKQHELTVSHFLKKLPSEVRQQVLKLKTCNLEIPDNGDVDRLKLPPSA